MVAVYHGERGLVGAGAEMTLVELTRDFIGVPYELGANDCFSLITQYLKKRGIKHSKRLSA